jgi:hypothetical protein
MYIALGSIVPKAGIVRISTISQYSIEITTLAIPESKKFRILRPPVSSNP